MWVTTRDALHPPREDALGQLPGEGPQPGAHAATDTYIDYVIAHELCHLVEHNHGPRCYALLDRHHPVQERAAAGVESVRGGVGGGG